MVRELKWPIHYREQPHNAMTESGWVVVGQATGCEQSLMRSGIASVSFQVLEYENIYKEVEAWSGQSLGASVVMTMNHQHHEGHRHFKNTTERKLSIPIPAG